jgi:general secretion pathway protein I
MVALTIVAITLAAGMRASEMLSLGADRADDTAQARWCADNHLSNLKLLKKFPDLGRGEFSCQQMGRSYQGRIQVSPTPNPNFRRVDVTVLSPADAPLLLVSTIVSRY